MLALARVGVFVESGTVEEDQPVCILREVRGNPIDDHTDSRLMTGIHEILEIIGCAETRGRREIPDHLVAPRPGVRIFHHRQQLDVRVAHLLHIFHEFHGQLAVGKHLTHRAAHPAFQMDLVNRHG